MQNADDFQTTKKGMRDLFDYIASSDDCSCCLGEAVALAEERRDDLFCLIGEFQEPLSNGVHSLMESTVRCLFVGNPEESVFYARLWDQISSNPLIESDEGKQFALLTVLLDPRLPYKKYDLVSMTNEEFAERRDRLESAINELVRLDCREFSQKTESASAFLHVIESFEDKADRAVLLSVLLLLRFDDDED